MCVCVCVCGYVCEYFVWSLCIFVRAIIKVELHIKKQSYRTHESFIYIQIHTQLQYYVCQKANNSLEYRNGTYCLNIFSNVVNSSFVNSTRLFIECNYDSHTQCPKPCTVAQPGCLEPPPLKLHLFNLNADTCNRFYN